MKEEDKIFNKVGRETGYTVPDGYFEDVFQRIGSSLPDREEQPRIMVTRWQKLRPYLYMAAMFAGIWLMMKVFHAVSTPEQMSLDNMPSDLVAYVESVDMPDYYDEPGSSDIPESDLVDEIVDEYPSVDAITEKMGFVLDDEYARINID